MHVTGRVLVGPEYRPEPARVVVDDGRIAAIEEIGESKAGPDIVLPGFVNAHTHLGDSIAKEAGGGLSLDELVAPPDGLKHRILRGASREEKIEAMGRSIEFMADTGTVAFLDFREGGIDGVRAFREAADRAPTAGFAFGRGEASVLEIADGYGASGARDADFGVQRRRARELDKPFGIHAGERDATDVNDALDLDPDHLVHMVHPEALHLDRLEDTAIPVVVCPRSNVVTGVGRPPIGALLERTTVALGTDNVMLNSPSMFREMAITSKLFDLEARTVLRMATRAGAEILELECGILETGRPAAITVLDGSSSNLGGYQDPVRAAVRRAEPTDVAAVHHPELLR